MAKRKRLSFNGPLPSDDPATDAAPPIAGVVADASATAALTEMHDGWQTARETGRVLISLPLEQVQLDYLVRDRLADAGGDEMTALKESLRARGQQVPIEVARLAEDRFGLISGWRRCEALRLLHEETGEARFAKVDAILRKPAASSDAYCAMVEENELRVGLSYYERARIVLRAVEHGVFEDHYAALRSLFATASRAKRSKIGTFLSIVSALDGHLRFPASLAERQGLVLGRALDARPQFADDVIAALQAAAPGDAAAEAKCLAGVLAPTRPQKPEKKALTPISETLCPGIEMRVAPDGALILSGPRVNADLQERLRGFLAHDKAAW